MLFFFLPGFLGKPHKTHYGVWTCLWVSLAVPSAFFFLALALWVCGVGKEKIPRCSSKCRVQCFSLRDRGGGGLITCSKYSWLILVQHLALDFIFLSLLLIMHIKFSPFQNCTKLPAFNILFSSAYSLYLQWTVEIICRLKNPSVYEIVWIWFSCCYLYLCKIPKLKIQWSTD